MRSDDASDVVCHGEKCIRDLGTDAAIEAVNVTGAAAVLELADDGLYAVPLGHLRFPRVGDGAVRRGFWGATPATSASGAVPSAGRLVTSRGKARGCCGRQADGWRAPATNEHEATAALAAAALFATLAGLDKKAAVLRDAEVWSLRMARGSSTCIGRAVRSRSPAVAPSFESLNTAAVVGAGRAFPPVVDAPSWWARTYPFTVDVDA